MANGKDGLTGDRQPYQQPAVIDGRRFGNARSCRATGLPGVEREGRDVDEMIDVIVLARPGARPPVTSVAGLTAIAAD